VLLLILLVCVDACVCVCVWGGGLVGARTRSDGEVTASGTQALPSVAPHTSREIVIDGVAGGVADARLRDGQAELSLTITFELVAADRFRAAGFPLGIWYGDASPAERARTRRALPTKVNVDAKAAAMAVPTRARSLLADCLPCLGTADDEGAVVAAAPVSTHMAMTTPTAAVPALRRREPAVVVVDNGATLSISGGGAEGVPSFAYVVSRTLGKFTAGVFGGRTVFLSGPTPNVYRAPTDNDKGGAAASFDARWRQMGLHVATLQVRGSRLPVGSCAHTAAEAWRRPRDRTLPWALCKKARRGP
jgi:hypothetical protein